MISFYEELVEPSRRRILVALLDGPLTVTEVCRITGLKQPNVSNHLAVLRSKDMVVREKRGRSAFYSIASDAVREALSTLLRDVRKPGDGINVAKLSFEYANSAMEGDEAACMRLTERVLQSGLPLITVHEEFFGAAMLLVGKKYLNRECDEAQEHMASSVTERMLLRAALARQPSALLQSVAVAGCAPGELHCIGIRMVSDFLHSLGWRTYYLGANVPVEAFLAQVEQHNPDLVLIECEIPQVVPAALELVRSLRNMRLMFSIGLGGLAAVEHENEFSDAGATFVSSSLKEFGEKILPQLDLAERRGPYLQ